MAVWPYIHTASAAVSPEGQVSVAGPEPAAVSTAGFCLGGVGDMGSPETLMTCAVAWSFAAAFRTGAAEAGVQWRDLEVTVDATVDRNRRGPRLAGLRITVAIDVAGEPAPGSLDAALAHALNHCLATNSLRADTALDTRVRCAGGHGPPGRTAPPAGATPSHG